MDTGTDSFLQSYTGTAKIYRYKGKFKVRENKEGSTSFECSFLGIPGSFAPDHFQPKREAGYFLKFSIIEFYSHQNKNGEKKWIKSNNIIK